MSVQRLKVIILKNLIVTECLLFSDNVLKLFVCSSNVQETLQIITLPLLKMTELKHVLVK